MESISTVTVLSNHSTLTPFEWKPDELLFVNEIMHDSSIADESNRSMNCLLPFIDKKGMAVLDGGLATQLEHHGAVLKGDPLWSAKCVLSHPGLIQRVHLEYLNAGADIITTATYQASTDLLEKRGMIKADEQAQFYRSAVQLAKQSIDEHLQSLRTDHESAGSEPTLTALSQYRPLIAFSIGSYGASLGGGKEYSGDYGVPISDIIKFHKKRIRIVSKLEDIDLIAFETVPCRREAIAIITLLKDFPKLRCWLSFSCRNDDEIADGTPIVNVIKLVNSSKQIISVGVNCTAPEFIGPLVKKMACRTTKIVIAYPNKGEMYDPEIKNWKENSHKIDWTEQVLQWKKLGLGVIGGCCRTTPKDIAKVHEILMEQKKQAKSN